MTGVSGTWPRASPAACQGGRMRLLVVEDEARLARALQRGLTADGFTVDVAARRGGRPGPGARRAVRRRPARRDAAAAVRLRGGQAAAGRGQLGAGDDGLGQGRALRPGRRARLRRGRLPDQAVRLRRAAGPAARPAAPAERPAPAGARPTATSRLDPATREVTLGGRAGGAEPARARAARVLPASPRPGGHQDRAARPGLGRPRRWLRARTPSRCTSGTCAASSGPG